MIRWSSHPEHVDTLRSMAKDGATASVIAAAFKCERNAIIGAAHRYGVQLPGNRKGPPSPAKPPRSARKMPYVIHLKTKPKPPRLRAASAAPAPRMLSVVDLKNETCRWPYESGRQHPTFLFCGDPTADFDAGAPYCPAHMALAHDR